MQYILWLDQVAKDYGNLAGGKASNLGEMIRLKLPVPPGFVVTTKAFDKFLEASKIKEQIRELLGKCDVENTEQLLETSKKIKDLILAQDIFAPIKSEIVETYKNLSYSDQVVSEKVLKLISAGRSLAITAVRSSATTEDLPTASFAGQQASFLNIKGVKELLDSVKKCWASLYEPRAIFYRAKHGFKHASIAVIIQRMINSEKSGVMFTVNPATGKDVVLIEATWGLGEALVSGAVHPDSYIVSKDGEILEKKIGKKEKMRIRDYASDRTIEISIPKNKVNEQVLTEAEIQRLVKYGLQLEKHYRHPQDIEFAIERNKVYVVQTRAVTTEAKEEEVKIEAEPILKGLGVSPGVVTGKIKIVHGLEDITKIKPGDILVTTMTSPDLVPTMSKSGAIITDSGGTTCHAAIVSREMGIPCVVGTHNATDVLEDGKYVTVNAYEGFVYPGKVSIEKPEAEPEIGKAKTVVKVKVNLAFPERAEEIAKKVDGVGLLRIEHMIIKSGVHPAKLIKEDRKEEYIKILLDGIRPITKVFHPKPVWVRTLDARSDEFRNLEGGEIDPKEANPMLGWHGVRRSLDEPELLKAEFEAIKKLYEEGLDNVHVMLPFIISVDEFKEAKEIAKEVGLPEKCRLGIMIETPSAALTIEDFCKEGIDFVSIGSNDLAQTVLGVDRNNEKISGLFDELSPAMLKLMQNIIQVCNKYKVESSICGEAPSNRPKIVKFLVKYGISSISVNIDAIERTRKTIFEAEKEIFKIR
jgi:pyruvate,water dikinase